MNKFSDYLNEQGFYFSNINNPDKTLFGADIKKNKKAKKDPKEDEQKKAAKLSNYLQIFNSIQ